MSLTRREILEQLSRLGIRTIDGLKKGCRDYEAYWSGFLGRPNGQLLSGKEDAFLQER
jgi:hypothetical protein